MDDGNTLALRWGVETERDTEQKLYARVQVNYNLFLDENHDHLVQIMAGGSCHHQITRG